MKLFGLTPGDVTFLGYPNQYLTDMWLPEHWLPTSPVRSRRTHATASPYRNSVTPGADLVSVELGRQAGRLIATLHTRARPRRGTTYHLSLHAGAAHPSQRVIAHYSWQGASASGVVVRQDGLAQLPAADLAVNGNTLAGPWPLREDTRFVLVRAWTSSGRRVLDETATTLVRLPLAQAGEQGAASSGQ